LKKRLAFIINPISGGINKSAFPQQVAQLLNADLFDYELFYTTSTEHNKQLAQQCVAERYDVVVAVGGDGTINNTAKYIAGTEVHFGLIPLGSGNGLARHHQLNPDIKKALQTLNQFNTVSIDTGTANGTFFINLAGVGFDAHVSWMFANAPKRGFVQYAKITLSEFAKYQSHEYEIMIDGKIIHERAFIVCVANGSQYGNNAFIAPTASTSDGLFEITIIKPFKIWQMPGLGVRMFNKSLLKSANTINYSGKHVVIKRLQDGVVNIDGEPVMMPHEVDIKLIHQNLKMIVP
jgi:diacylglycerol kinase (ATP)